MVVRSVLAGAWLIGVLGALLLGSGGVARAQESPLAATVVGVVDGDTLRVQLESGAVEVVRLGGLDAPESRHPTRPVGCYGPEASARLARLAAPGSSVELEVAAPERDRFGRLVAYVWRQDAMLMVNEQLLSEGYAVLLPTLLDPAFAEQFEHAEQVARSNRLGLWGACAGGLPDPTDEAPVLDP